MKKENIGIILSGSALVITLMICAYLAFNPITQQDNTDATVFTSVATGLSKNIDGLTLQIGNTNKDVGTLNSKLTSLTSDYNKFKENTEDDLDDLGDDIDDVNNDDAQTLLTKIKICVNNINATTPNLEEVRTCINNITL